MILQTDYTRRIWTGLTTDDLGEADLREGDVIYLMDVSECYVGGEGQMYQLPDLGGGGGTIISKTITVSGTYNAEDDNADGYNPVIVDIKPLKTLSLTVTNNKTGGSAYQRNVNFQVCVLESSNDYYISSSSVPGNSTPKQLTVSGASQLFMSCSCPTACAFAFSNANDAVVISGQSGSLYYYLLKLTITDNTLGTITISNA